VRRALHSRTAESKAEQTEVGAIRVRRLPHSSVSSPRRFFSMYSRIFARSVVTLNR